MRLAALAETALSLVLPPRCPGCGTVVAADATFCASCWSELTFITEPMCPRCGEPSPVDTAGPCFACNKRPPRYTAARAAIAYDDGARRIVLGLKHADAPHLARAMAAQMARAGSAWLGPGSLIVPVPLHRWRLWRRGYNQAALIARVLARRTGAKLDLDALTRTRATASSGGLGRAERFDNVAAAFVPRRGARLAGRDIVLVDDVLTSGATADACADALVAAGAATVRVLTFARVVRGVGGRHILPNE